MKEILGNLRRTIHDFDMIKEDDHIAVGLSGGKDSMILLYYLKQFQRFSPIKYKLSAIMIDLGFGNFNIGKTKDFCEELGVDLIVEKTNIAKVVFEVRKEKNPCGLCSNMRRGTLGTVMKREGMNVLALGHHEDDAIETFMMNLLYTGKLKTLDQKKYLSRSKSTVIRPLINVKEKQIINAVLEYKIPVTKSPCPMDKATKREKTKKMLESIYGDVLYSRESILRSMKNKEQFNLWF